MPGQLYDLAADFALPPSVFRTQPMEQFAVSTPFKLLFCYIPKNGCTKLKSLFLKLASADPGTYADLNAVHVSFSKQSNIRAANMPTHFLDEAVAGNDWIRAVILRDPLERFLSAYLDKIVGRENLAHFRLKGLKFGTDAASMHTFLQNRSSWSFEPHFSLQKDACAFQTSWGYWNKILIYDGNEQSAELTSKMFDNRIDFPILHGWGGDGAIWSKRTSHSTANSEQKRILLKNICGSQTLWAELLSYLQPDYDFFNFAPPRLCENYNPE